MRLMVLGPVEVEAVDGASEPVGPPREQILIVALALAAPESLSVGRLIDVIWGDDPPVSAAGTLKSLVHRLRRRHGSVLIATITGGYRLGKVGFDVAEVRLLLESGRRAMTEGAAADAVAQCDEALEAFRGPPSPALSSTVAGLSLGREIETLRAQVIGTRLDARLAAGEGADLIGELEASVEVDPLDERGWERLMLALYRSGRQVAALGAFQRARTALVERAGVEPGPGLQDLERRIVDQDRSLLHDADSGSLPAPPRLATVEPSAIALVGDMTWTETTSLLVGRDEQLAAINAQVAAVRRSEDRHLVLIEGAAGMGKTVLAAQAASGAANQGDLVLYGRCDENSPAPYRPFTTAFGRLVDFNPPKVVETTLGSDGDLLARVVPSFRDSFTIEEEPSPDLDGLGIRVFDAASRWLDRLGRGRSVVLVIDDLHWATGPTIDLLRHLVDDPRSGVTFIATYRGMDMGVDHPFAAALPLLMRQPNTTSIELGRLSPSDIGRYTEFVTDQAAPPAVVDRIWTATGGVPYLVSSSLAFLTSEEEAERRSGRWVLRSGSLEALPVGVKHLVEARMARLEPETVTFLRVAAVAGMDFEVDVVGSVAGFAVGEAIDAVESAELAGLVREREYGRWSWDHDIARMVVLADLSMTRRVQTHWKVAEVLAGRHKVDFDDVAFHATEGLLAAPPHRVATLLLAAAEDALDRSVSGSLDHATTALEALDGDDESALTLRAQLLTVRAIAVFETSRDPDEPAVIDAMIEAEQASLATGDPELIVRAHTLEGRYPGGRQIFQFDARRVKAGFRALDALPVTALDQRVTLLGHLIQLHTYDWDAPSSARISKDLLTVADQRDRSLAAALRAQNLLALLNSPPFVTTAALREQIRTGRSGFVGVSPSPADSRDASEEIDTVVEIDELERSLRAGQFTQVVLEFQALEGSGESFSLNDQISLVRLRCVLAAANGDAPVLRNALEWFDDLRPRPRLHRFIQELRRELTGSLTLVTGQAHGFAEAFEEVLSDQHLAPPFRTLCRVVAAWEYLVFGDHENAERIYRTHDPDWHSGRAPLLLPAVVGVVSAESVTQFGTSDEIAALRQLLLAQSGKWAVGPIFCLGPVDVALGVIDRALGEDPAPWFANAAELARSAGSTWWESRILEMQ